jgi:hypothetical protein
VIRYAQRHGQSFLAVSIVAFMILGSVLEGIPVRPAPVSDRPRRRRA